MTPRQEFLILESGDNVAVYTPKTFPQGTPIGPDAKRLGIDGPARAQPPASHLSREEFDRWRGELEREGYTVTLGPFWRDPTPPEEVEELIRGRGKTVTLEEFRNELLGRAGGNGQPENRGLEPTEPSAD